MGLGNNSNKGGATFLDIRNGKVTKRADGPGEGVVERTITKGKNAGMVVHEHHYGFVEGFIRGLAWSERESEVAPGKMKTTRTLQVTMEDVGERFILNLPRSYKVTRHFLLALPNIDPGSVVRVEPYDYIRKKDGKRISGLGVMQGDQKVEWAFTRGDGKLPDAPMVKVNGEDVVDYTEQDSFLDKVLADAMPRFNGKGEPVAAAAVAANEDDDDLPF